MGEVDRARAKYPGFLFGRSGVCTYCGEPASDKDHIIAVSFLTSAQRKGHPFANLGPRTPACQQCNGVLSNRFFDTFRLRCLFVYDSLIKKAGHASAEWKESELVPLGYTLQSFIRHRQELRKWYLLRADWFLSDDYYLGIESLLYECFLIESHPRFNCEYLRYFRDTLFGINRCLDSRQAKQRD